MNVSTCRSSARRAAACLALLAIGPLSAARAQTLVLDAQMAYDAFVMHEPLTLRLSLANQGASPYIVDDYGTHRDNTLTIHLKSQEDGFLTARTPQPFGDAMVMPGAREILEADLMKVFPVAKPGRYFAQVLVKRADEAHATRLLMFDIVQGIEIASTARPLPDYDNLSRTYTLLYWPRNQTEVLFLRIVETPPGHCVGLLQLGNIVRFAPPRFEFSPDGGTLTVQHQSSRDLYIRTVLQTDRSGIRVLERQQLLNPNLTPMSRAILEERTQAVQEPDEDGFIRRVRPAPDASKPGR